MLSRRMIMQSKPSTRQKNLYMLSQFSWTRYTKLMEMLPKSTRGLIVSRKMLIRVYMSIFSQNISFRSIQSNQDDGESGKTDEIES